MSDFPTPDIRWFHSFAFEDGTSISGIRDIDILRREADLVFAHGVEGKTVLDIGAWDGFFSFEAEKRGAARVLATDHFCWSGTGWGTRDGFDHVHARLGSTIEAMDVDTIALPGSGLSRFDVVLFLGVFYHLKDPYLGLEAAAAMSADHLVVETVTGLPRETLPAMRLFEPGELNGDTTNFWAPNLPALEVMLRSFGFSRIAFVPSPVTRRHPLNAGSLRRPKQDALHRTIVHAWR